MSDWQAGDLALCIKAGRRTRAGCVYTVAHVTTCVLGPSLVLREFIAHPDHSKRTAWVGRFRKVTPPKAEADDLEVISIMCSRPREVV